MRSNCIVSYVPTSHMLTGHDHIKGSSSKWRKGKFPGCHQISVVSEASRFPSWVGYIMNTEAWLESYTIIGELPEEGALRVPSCCSLPHMKETFSLFPLFPGTVGMRFKTRA